MPIDKAQTLIAKPCTVIDKSDWSIASRRNPIDNPLMVMDSQRTFIDSGALVISSQRTSVDNCDDSISEAFNPVYGADNRIVERRKRVAEKFAASPLPAGAVCKPKLRIAKAGLAIAARYKRVAMPLLAVLICRGIGVGRTDVVGGLFMEVGGHWVVLLKTPGTEPNSQRFVE